jgi:hypothetical protein
MWGAVFVFLEVAILGGYLLMKEENDVQVPSELEELRQLQRARQIPCLWEQDMDGNWQTGCDSVFVLVEGGPEENRLKFCPYCGHPLEEMK